MRDVLLYIVLVINLVSMVALISGILLHSGRGGGLSDMFGGGGGAALAGADAGTCELRKMYFLPALRGLGAGRALMATCLDAARAAGFRRCYLETLTGMDTAQRLYERSGFARIAGPMGATGHFGCNRFYLKDL